MYYYYRTRPLKTILIMVLGGLNSIIVASWLEAWNSLGKTLNPQPSIMPARPKNSKRAGLGDLG